MTCPPEAGRWIAEKAAEVLLAAVDGDTETVAQAISAVGVRYDNRGVYSLCCALAEAIAVMGRFDRDTDAWYGFEIVDLPTGKRLDSRDVPADSATMVSAHQFLIALLNHDTAQSLALFAAEPIRVATGLATLAAVYGRDRLQEDRAQS